MKGGNGGTCETGDFTPKVTDDVLPRDPSGTDTVSSSTCSPCGGNLRPGRLAVPTLAPTPRQPVPTDPTAALHGRTSDTTVTRISSVSIVPDSLLHPSGRPKSVTREGSTVLGSVHKCVFLPNQEETGTQGKVEVLLSL